VHMEEFNDSNNYILNMSLVHALVLNFMLLLFV